jgi:hypothetical protein
LWFFDPLTITTNVEPIDEKPIEVPRIRGPKVKWLDTRDYYIPDEIIPPQPELQPKLQSGGREAFDSRLAAASERGTALEGKMRAYERWKVPDMIEEANTALRDPASTLEDIAGIVQSIEELLNEIEQRP